MCSLPLEDFSNNEAIQCTEVYEYAQTLGNERFSLPQFQVLYLPVFFYCIDHLVGLVVKASASRVEDPGFESRLRQDFSALRYQ